MRGRVLHNPRMMNAKPGPRTRSGRLTLSRVPFAVLAVLAGTWMGARAQEASPLLLGPRIDADEVRVTVFARDLFFPMGMVRLPDGSLLVGTSVPAGGGYFHSAGEL